VDYNFVADITGLSSFIRLAVVAFQISKSCKIPTKFDLIAVQGHPRSSILMSIKSPGAISY